jgi:hypothetical protein
MGGSGIMLISMGGSGNFEIFMGGFSHLPFILTSESVILL